MVSPKTLISRILIKEANQCIKPDAIDRITPLRRNPTAAEYHSVIVFSKYPEELNTWIERGFSINYQIYRTQRYTKRAQLIQCFNCYGYGHHARTQWFYLHNPVLVVSDVLFLVHVQNFWHIFLIYLLPLLKEVLIFLICFKSLSQYVPIVFSFCFPR
jgi:hypothetical protein